MTTKSNVIDKLLLNCRAWEHDFAWDHLPATPLQHVAVIACMDSRQPLKHMLGLRPGDAHFIRNAGGLVTDDVLRSLLISVHVKKVREVMIVQHTSCGMLGLDEDQLRAGLEKKFGRFKAAPLSFGGFASLDESVRAHTQRVRDYQWLPKDLLVRGFVYDVTNGHMREVK